MSIELKKIRRDGGTQSRATVNADVVAEYADRMREGTAFPPVTLFYDGKTYWLADGFHRAAAAEACGLGTIEADIRQGTQRDAVLYSVGVNAAHGLRRTNDDKRRAVEVLLRDPEWRLWSDREMARIAAVDHKTVGKWRAELVQRGEIPHAITAAAKDSSQQIETDLEYPPGVSDNADVEAARQIAIQALALWPVHHGSIDEVPYRIGKGELIDAAGRSHPVGANHVAVALTTNNGAGIYRFYADQLAAWMDERNTVVRDKDVLNGLYYLLCGGRASNYQVGKNMDMYGLAMGFGKGVSLRLTAFGRQTIEAYINGDPRLAIEHKMRTKSDLSGALGDGIKALASIYKGHKKSEWTLVENDWSSSGLYKWAEALAKEGFLRLAKRRPVGRESHLTFYTVTESGAELLGSPVLPSLPDLPDVPYHMTAHVFVSLDAQFTLKVGDTVKQLKGKNIGRVMKLGKWPEFQVKQPGYHWNSTWFENQVEVVLEGSGPNPVALAELDMQTTDVWERAQSLLNALKRWTSDEEDDPHGLNPKDGALDSLTQLMAWVSDTYSGQRLKLEMPEGLEEMVAE